MYDRAQAEIGGVWGEVGTSSGIVLAGGVRRAGNQGERWQIRRALEMEERTPYPRQGTARSLWPSAREERDHSRKRGRSGSTAELLPPEAEARWLRGTSGPPRDILRGAKKTESRNAMS